MTFTVRDFHDLVEIMETQPVWRAEMRRLVLTDDILNLPQEIRELSQFVQEVAEMSRQDVARFTNLETKIAEADERNEVRFTNLERDINDLKSDVGVLKSDVNTLKTDVADVKGDSLERRVRERPYVYLSRFARRLRLVDDAELGRLIDDAVDQPLLSEAEAEDLKLIDVVARGQTREQRTELYLAGEVSGVVNDYDLTRAITRAALLQKATGVKTIPVVLGKTIHDRVRRQAEAAQANWVLLPA